MLQHEEPEPADLVDVGMYATATEGFERGLVALAMGTRYWLEPYAGGYRLRVEAAQAADVAVQLAKFERENAHWPPRPEMVRHANEARSTELFTPLLWVGAVVGGYAAQARWPQWSAEGALDPMKMFEAGELWRAGTALFLHADPAHLVANAISGFFAFAAVLTTLGRARGWWTIAATAVIGNLAAAALQIGVPYRSVGASTAVFAALGVLAGRAVRVSAAGRRRGRENWIRAAFLPLGTGIAVLGLFGAGDQRVDVLAHLTGFIAGVVGGLLAGSRPTEARQDQAQAAFASDKPRS